MQKISVEACCSQILECDIFYSKHGRGTGYGFLVPLWPTSSRIKHTVTVRAKGLGEKLQLARKCSLLWKCKKMACNINMLVVPMFCPVRLASAIMKAILFGVWNVVKAVLLVILILSNPVSFGYTWARHISSISTDELFIAYYFENWSCRGFQSA
jgi:hypothetical protein